MMIICLKRSAITLPLSFLGYCQTYHCKNVMDWEFGGKTCPCVCGEKVCSFRALILVMGFKQTHATSCNLRF